MFWGNWIHTFFIAFGVMMGASIFAGIGALISDRPPLKTMTDVAHSVKIWAVAIALGDTFASLAVLEQGIVHWKLRSFARQVLYIIAAFSGANCGLLFIRLFHRSGELWRD